MAGSASTQEAAVFSATEVPRVALIVADDGERELLENILLGRGYRVESHPVIDGQSEECLLSFLPDLIVMGNDAEEMSAICRILSHHDDLADIPVLVIRDPGCPEEAFSGLSAWVVDFVQRPFIRERVLVQIDLLLRLGSQRKEIASLRAQLLDAQKKECLGSLAAGIVHEMNNLMFSVMGYADLALSAGEDDLEALRESAEISYETAKRATACAAGLLSFTRRKQDSKDQASINDAITGALRLVRKDLEKNGVEVVLKLEDVPQTQMSLGSMQQVFLNLVINAKHAMEERGGKKRLTIESRREGMSKIKVTVADTGIGIAPEDQAKIFDAFYTSKSQQNGYENEGSGLGLTVVTQVVRDHQGIINVKSQPGKGTVFTVTVPILQAEAEERAETGGSREVPKERYSILIVDDEEPSRRVLTRLLVKRGHEARSASCMVEAMPILWGNHIDLIVMDMVMPTEDGATNIQRLRDEGIDIPVLICTGHADNRALTLGMDAGANGLIMKPFSAREFLREMHRCLGAKQEAA